MAEGAHIPDRPVTDHEVYTGPLDPLAGDEQLVYEAGRTQ